MNNNLFKKVESKTNVKKSDILELAKSIQNKNMSDEKNLRELIQNIAKMAGKDVDKEKEEKIINAVKNNQINDQIKKRSENMEYIKTKAEFEKLINENQNVVIDFFAEWCGPCKMLGPVIENVANIQNKAKIVKVNVDEADELSAMFGIRSIPTIVYIKDKKLVNTELGFKTKEQILANIDKIF